jgi:hypothetical protein
MFRAPAGAAAAIAALLLAAWLLSNGSVLDARDSAIAAGIGLVIYFAYRRRVKARTSANDGHSEQDQPPM